MIDASIYPYYGLGILTSATEICMVDMIVTGIGNRYELVL